VVRASSSFGEKDTNAIDVCCWKTLLLFEEFASEMLLLWTIDANKK